MANFVQTVSCPSCCGVGRDGKSRECEACDGSGMISIPIPSGIAIVDVFPARATSASTRVVQ
jgi:DnaJ-class molecular chaperone